MFSASLRGISWFWYLKHPGLSIVSSVSFIFTTSCSCLRVTLQTDAKTCHVLTGFSSFLKPWSKHSVFHQPFAFNAHKPNTTLMILPTSADSLIYTWTPLTTVVAVFLCLQDTSQGSHFITIIISTLRWLS